MAIQREYYTIELYKENVKFEQLGCLGKRRAALQAAGPPSVKMGLQGKEERCPRQRG